MKFWNECYSNELVQPITAEPWRVIEAQHVLSSRDLVDSREEHDVLEELLENSKPEIEKNTNYLIFTPFRYPPLKYGSRFGRTFEPSLWYGSLQLDTAFTEVAYYRFKFLEDTEGDLGYLEITMTAFTAFLNAERGLDLTQMPFKSYTPHISDPNNYEFSQLLGTSMREEQIQAFIYFSARTHQMAKNIAAFTPDVFKTKINKQQTWVCLANKNSIEFFRIGFLGKERFSFSKDYFNPCLNQEKTVIS